MREMSLSEVRMDAHIQKVVIMTRLGSRSSLRSRATYKEMNGMMACNPSPIKSLWLLEKRFIVFWNESGNAMFKGINFKSYIFHHVIEFEAGGHFGNRSTSGYRNYTISNCYECQPFLRFVERECFPCFWWNKITSNICRYGILPFRFVRLNGWVKQQIS